MYAKIVIIVLVVMALGAGLFLYHGLTSGGIRVPSFSFPSSSQFSLIPSRTGPVLPAIPAGTTTISSGGTYISGTPGSGGGAQSLIVNTSTIPASEIPAGWTASNLSPYFHEIRLGGVSAGSYYYYGTISLYAYFPYQATGTIDITGWQIKTRGSGEYIPQAIAVYDPSGLTAPSDIRVANGDTVYLYSSSAPFNLRLNECIGYVANMANFRPALPANCPQVDESRIVNFTGGCQAYLQSFAGCSQPTLPNPLVPPTDYACQDFIRNNFNYKSCFEAHIADPNFLSNQVWVWTGSNVVNQYHDTVDLLDRNGLLVDQYSY